VDARLLEKSAQSNAAHARSCWSAIPWLIRNP
jgi:hypothetical protein